MERYRVTRKTHTSARRYDKIIDYLDSSLWFRPTLWMIACTGLAITLIALDTWLDSRDALRDWPTLLRSDPDDARTMLGAIVGAMLTVVSLAFSVVMLAVVQIAQAYTPRLLREYIGDPRSQHVLGVLIGTFLYSLLVLRSIRYEDFAPTLATNMGVILAVVSTMSLIAFLHHVPQSIKVSAIIHMILEANEEELEREFPAGLGSECWNIPSDDDLRDEPAVLLARDSGYIELFDMHALSEREGTSSAIIRMHWRMGEFVLEHSPLASVWGEFDEHDREALYRACVLGHERTMRQDPRFGIAQLTDVALRALSPAVNDPSTACDAVNALSVLLAKLLDRESASHWRCDGSGQLRVEFQLATFAELIETSYLRILGYGSKDQQVVHKLIGACEQLASINESSNQHDTLWTMLQTIHTVADEHVAIKAHRRALDQDFERAARALARPPLRALADTALQTSEPATPRR